MAIKILVALKWGIYSRCLKKFPSWLWSGCDGLCRYDSWLLCPILTLGSDRTPLNIGRFYFRLWFTLAGASWLLFLLFFCYEWWWCSIPRLAHHALRTFIAKAVCGSPFCWQPSWYLGPSLWCRNKPYIGRCTIKIWWLAREHAVHLPHIHSYILPIPLVRVLKNTCIYDLQGKVYFRMFTSMH